MECICQALHLNTLVIETEQHSFAQLGLPESPQKEFMKTKKLFGHCSQAMISCTFPRPHQGRHLVF